MDQNEQNGMNKYLAGSLTAIAVSIVATLAMALFLHIAEAPILGRDIIMDNLGTAMVISSIVSIVVGFVLTLCVPDTFGGDTFDVCMAFGVAAAIVTVIVCLVYSIALKGTEPEYVYGWGQ